MNIHLYHHFPEDLTMADVAALEAQLAQLTAATTGLTAAVVANGERTSAQDSALVSAVAAAQNVPDGDVAGVAAAIVAISTATSALNIGAVTPAPAP